MSADRLDRLPETEAEVAVVGRSNVGKSSLINALARRKALANTSKTPGRTQLLNVFAFPDGTTMVDCPGYGYAKVSKAKRAEIGRAPSELQSLMRSSYAVFCLKKKKIR